MTDTGATANGVTVTLDWNKLANSFFQFAKTNPCVACYLFTTACAAVTVTVCVTVTRRHTKAESLRANS